MTGKYLGYSSVNLKYCLTMKKKSEWFSGQNKCVVQQSVGPLDLGCQWLHDATSVLCVGEQL